jgi:hypothetical protein
LLRKHLVGTALFLFISAGWLLIYNLYPEKHPADSDLLSDFQRHRATLLRLAFNAGEDQEVSAFGSDYVEFNDYRRWPRDGESLFSRQRWHQYQDLFDRLGRSLKYRSMDIDRGHQLIEFPVSIKCFDEDADETNVTVKGYVYSSAPLPETGSLDHLGIRSVGRFYRKIDAHWYLYFDGGWTHGE